MQNIKIVKKPEKLKIFLLKIIKKPEKRRIFRTNDATFKNDATCLVFNVDIGFFLNLRYGVL